MADNSFNDPLSSRLDDPHAGNMVLTSTLVMFAIIIVGLGAGVVHQENGGGVIVNGTVTAVIPYQSVCSHGRQYYICNMYDTRIHAVFSRPGIESNMNVSRQYAAAYDVGHTLLMHIDLSTGNTYNQNTVAFGCGIAIIVFGVLIILWAIAMGMVFCKNVPQAV